MELQTDRTEIAPGGPSEVAEPLCAAHLRCAVHHAPLQEIAETVSRALAYLIDRLIWPYCLPAKADQCLALHEKIERAHVVYQRYAKHNAANFMLSELHDNLARLLGNSLLDERDHTPMERDLNFRDTGEIISVQDWMTTAGMTQPLAQRCERDDSIVPKEAVVETVRRNLAELRARRNDEHGLSRGVKRPIEPGPTVGAKEAAHNQADANAASARGTFSFDLVTPGIDWSDIDHGLSDSDYGYDDDDEYKDDYDDVWDDETTCFKFSTTTTSPTTTETSDVQLITTPPHIFRFGSLAPPKAIHVDDPPPNDHADPTADECADSTADDCAVFAENRADFTANGRADSIANDRADSTADDRADSNMGDDGLSNATHDVAEVGSVAKTLLGNDLNDALRKQTLTLGQLRSAVAVKLSTTASRLKEDKAITALLKEEFTAMHLLEMERPAAATAVASQVESNATFAAPVSSSPETDDAPPMPKGASTSALHAGPDAQRRPPGPSGRRRTDTPVRRRPLGTRLFERPSPLGRNALPAPVPPPGSHPPPPPPPEPPPTQHPADRHAPPTPVPPPGSHPAPLPPPEPPPVQRPTCRHAPPAPVPPPGSHPAPLPPPEPPPVQHPAPLPPPQPPPELGGGESDDENWAPWTPYYLPASTTTASATTATARAESPRRPADLPDDTAPANVVPAKRP